MVVLRSRRSTLPSIALIGAMSFAASSASADVPSSDKVAAEALFDEARALMKEGKNELACPKLAESQRLDPGIGTLLYLASCYEKTGRLATAWVTFREAGALAHNAGQAERERMAAARAAALDPLLPHLTIRPDVKDGEPEILRDGVPVAKALWGTAVPVDPGTHTVEARLAGHVARSISVSLGKGESADLPIPVLERAHDDAPITEPRRRSEVAPEPPAAAPPPLAPKASSRVPPLVAAGIGVGGVAVGTIFGVRALSLASDVDDACPAGPCSHEVRVKADDSRAAGNVSTVGFAVGVVGLAAAAVLWFSAPRASRSFTATARGVTIAF